MTLIHDGLLTYHVNEISACNYHRIQLPMEFLPPPNIKVPILFYNRLAVSRVFQESFKKRGGKIILDMDDDVHLGCDHVLHRQYQESGITDQLIDNVRLADVVLVTNAELARRLSVYNPNIEIVPNALPFDQGQFKKHNIVPEDTLFVYAGGATHFEDLKSILPAVPRSDFTLAGYEPNNNQWRRIRSLYPFARYKTSLPLKRYMEAYDGHAVSIAPLTNTRFNRAKSNLKMLEAGAKHLSFIASAIPPYINDKDGPGVLYADNKASWREAFRRLGDASFRLEQASALAAHVRERYQLSAANTIRRQLMESFS